MSVESPPYVTKEDYYKWRVKQDEGIARELKRHGETISKLEVVTNKHKEMLTTLVEMAGQAKEDTSILMERTEKLDRYVGDTSVRLVSLDNIVNSLKIEIRRADVKANNSAASRAIDKVEMLPVVRQGRIELPSARIFPTTLRGWFAFMRASPPSSPSKLVRFYDIDSFRSWPEDQLYLNPALTSSKESDSDAVSDSGADSESEVDSNRSTRSMSIEEAVLEYPNAALYDVMKCVGLKCDLVVQARVDYERFLLQQSEQNVRRKRNRQNNDDNNNTIARKKSQISVRKIKSLAKRSGQHLLSQPNNDSLGQSAKSSSGNVSWVDYRPIGQSVKGTLSLDTCSDAHLQGKGRLSAAKSTNAISMRDKLPANSPLSSSISHAIVPPQITIHRSASASEESLHSSSSDSATDVIPVDHFRGHGPPHPNTTPVP